MPPSGIRHTIRLTAGLMIRMGQDLRTTCICKCRVIEETALILCPEIPNQEVLNYGRTERAILLPIVKACETKAIYILVKLYPWDSVVTAYNI